MLIKRKPHRKFTELESKSYIREYLSSSDRRKTFERRNGLSLGTLSRWMKMYEIEDPKMQKSCHEIQLGECTVGTPKDLMRNYHPCDWLPCLKPQESSGQWHLQ